MKFRPKICASIACSTVEDALAMAEAARISGADLVELRADYLKSTEGLEDFVKCVDLPKILTLRKSEEGGVFKGSEKRRVKLLLELAECDYAYVDVELSTPSLRDVVRKIKSLGRRIIISFHDMSSTPSRSSLRRIARREAEAGADICKIVTTARSVDDCVTCLMLVSEGAARGVSTIAFAMGRQGVLSRVLAPIFGAPFTYAAVFRGKEAAPGQLTVLEMRRIYRELS